MKKLIKLSCILSTLCIANIVNTMDLTNNQNVKNIDQLNVLADNPLLRFKLLTYNVDQAEREEKYEATKWVNRISKVVKLVKNISPDIACLQEMRVLKNSPSINEFLAKFKKYRHFVAYKNPQDMAFGQATLYNPKKFFPLIIFPKYLSHTPHEVSDTYTLNPDRAFGIMVLCVKFMPVYKDKIVKNASPLWVFNTHFPLDEEVKTKCSEALVKLVKEVAGDEPFVICGDFNFFPDRDGDKQRTIITKHFKDLGKDAKTSQGALAIEGTFVGYEHDLFKAIVNSESKFSEMNSRLDHVFSSQNLEKDENAILYTETTLEPEPKELSERNNLPSDHLPLMVSIFQK